MNLVGIILISLVSLGGGLVFQFFTSISPWINLALSFLLILLLPPFWGLGLVCGLWISCAFITYHPELANQIDKPNRLSLIKVLGFAALTFAGFLMTLILLWRLKITSDLNPMQREVTAWIFLVIIEISLYKVIALLSPGIYRIPLGYGIACLNFLMIFYWVFSEGLYAIILVFLSLMILNPLLLTWVEPVNRQGEPYHWRNR